MTAAPQKPVLLTAKQAAKIIDDCRQPGLSLLEIPELDALRAIATGEAEVRAGWQPIESAPYNEVCLFLIDGHVAETFIYDGSADDMFGKGRATHWMPLPTPPKESA